MQILKYGLGLLVLGFLSSCKKDAVINNLTTTDTTTVTTSADKVKDTVVAFSKDVYLWYNQIPGTFNPQTYSDPDKIMTALRQYSIEPGFSAPVDRWSFAMKQQEWDNLSSGVSGDFGLGVFFRADGDLRIKYVESASPAGKAGIRRGWRILKIAGNSNISKDNADFIVQHTYQSNSTSFTFQKPDNSTADITLNTAQYQEHPIYLDTVYQTGGKNIGYLVFQSFLGDTAEIYTGFQRVFNRFAQAGVSDVIVDLRYNGGGYVTVQSKLANYLVNASANGKLMMRQQYNNKYSEQNVSENFRKMGALNLNRVFFIVSNNTASASELLINNLKPYMDVKLIGPSNTYGKPVGFFPIPVSDWYIFPVSFRTTNNNGEGNYFNGLTTNNLVADGLDKDWGNTEESCLASAIKYITAGTFRTMATEAYQQQQQVEAANAVLSRTDFKGTVGTRKW